MCTRQTRGALSSHGYAAAVRWLAWIPPVAIAGALWWASSTPDLAIASGTLDTVLRKMAHVAVFGALGGSLIIALRVSGAGAPRAIVGGTALALAYAIVDEVHQTQVPTRNGSPIDVAIDAFGIGVAAALGVYRLRRCSR